MRARIDAALNWWVGGDERPRRSLSPVWVLLALFALGFLLRVMGVEWGTRHGDERINFAAKVLSGQLVPPTHYYPPLNGYLMAVSFGVMFVVGRLLGIYRSVQDFKLAYFEDINTFYIVARVYTALISAATAPIAALIARRLGISWRGSYLVGLLMALLPPSVWWAHLAKPQMGMVTGCLLVGLAVLYFLDHLDSKWAAVGVGAAAAFATAYKQNAIFLVVPLLLTTAGLAYARTRDARQVATAGAIIAAVGLVAWSVMSIGALMDLQNFIDHQRIQSQMSNRPFSLSAFFSASVFMVGGLTSGATPFIFLGFLAVPAFDRDPRILMFWGCSLFGFLWVASIVGDRTLAGLYLHFVSFMVIVFAVVALRLVERGPDLPRYGAAAGLALGVAGCILGSLLVVRQAVQAPSHREITAFLEERVERDAWILASEPTHLGLDESVEARAFTRERHERLAKKYKIDLPPPAPEWALVRPNPYESWNVVRYPWPPLGIEHLSDEEISVVKAFSWPRQLEEWTIDYWTQKGFHWFVVLNEQHHIDNWPEPYSSFHQSMRDRCELQKLIPPRRPLFFETEAKIYRCGS